MTTKEVTPMEAYHLLAQYHALKLECKGMKHSSGRSIAKHVRQAYQLDCGRSKSATLQAFESYLRNLGVLTH